MEETVRVGSVKKLKAKLIERQSNNNSDLFEVSYYMNGPSKKKKELKEFMDPTREEVDEDAVVDYLIRAHQVGLHEEIEYDLDDDRVRILRDLLPLFDLKFIHFVARLTRDLGIDRLPVLAHGLTAPTGKFLRLKMKELAAFILDPEFHQVWQRVIGFTFEFVDYRQFYPPCLWLDIICPALATLTSLKRLGVYGFTRLWPVEALFDDPIMCKLETVDLLNPHPNQDLTPHHAEAMVGNGVLKKLTVSHLNSDVLQGLLRGLLNPSSNLHTLDTGYIELEDSVALAMSEVLCNPVCPLRSLRMRLTKVSETGEEWLAKALQSPHCKLSLVLHDPVIGSRSLPTAVASPQCSLRWLELEHDFESHKLSQAWADAIGTPECKLERLFLSDWNDQIMEALSKNKNLKHLTMRSIESSKCILESNIEVLVVKGLDQVSVPKLCELVANPNCKLQELQIYFHREAQTTINYEKLLLGALESNYHSLLRELNVLPKWSAPTFESKVNQLLQRNAYFESHDQFAKPTTAKLFLCGHARVGKTTIAKNLTRPASATYWPAFLQRHDSTSGIQLQPLQFEGSEQNLLICDLAGQQEYHAFHHYFVRGSEKNLFLVVCKVLKGKLKELKDELMYWLRFIVSHKSLAAGPTTVLIALNYFSKKEDMEFNVHDVVTTICNRYSQTLQVEKNNIFDLVATKVTDVQQKKDNLQNSLADLMEKQLTIPMVCKVAKGNCQRLVQQGTCKMLPIEEVAIRLLEDSNAIPEAVKIVLGVLHDTGDVIYFGWDQEEGIISEYTIVDVQWFLRDVISDFLKPAEGGKSDLTDLVKNGHADREKIFHKLEAKCRGHNAKYIFETLLKMGVLLPSQESESKIIIPALLTEKYGPSRHAEESPKQNWGRRFGCKDKQSNLLPAAIFAALQVQLQKLCSNNPSFKVGNGWASFEDGCITVVGRVGGDTDSWEDRQWVDVMISTLLETQRKGVEKDVEEWMKKVRNSVTRICLEACPSLELEESVMRSGYVRQRLAGTETQQVLEGQWEKQVYPLEMIKAEAREKGLDRAHTWESGFWDDLGALLLPNEQQYQLRVKADEVTSLAKSYKEIVSKTYSGAPTLTEVQASLRQAHSFRDPELGKAVGQIMDGIDHMKDHMDKRFDRIELSLEEIKQDMSLVIATGKKILAKCSRMLQNVDVDCPRFPHFTDESNSFQNYCKVIGKTVRLHYFCECLSGSHAVQGSQGVKLVLAPEWFQASAPVLKPALIILFIGAKIGGALGGAAEITNAVIDEAKGKLTEFLDSCIKDCHLVEAPSAKDLELIFDKVVKEVGGGEKKRIMQQHFALHRVSFENRTAWVCRDHLC